MTDGRTVLAVRVMGGLGNQLFQLAAALHLRDAIGVPVVLDRQFYAQEWDSMDPRHFEFDELPHGFTVIRGRGSASRLRALPRIVHRRLVTRGAPVILVDHAIGAAQAGDRSDPRTRAIAELAEHDPPRFQSAALARMSASSMRPLLEARIPTALLPEQDAPYVGVHCRLGDYLDPQWRSRLGAVDPTSLIALGRTLSRRHGDLPIRVFTDSPEILRHLCPTSAVGPYEISSARSSWDALAEMARSQAFVMSNSTLSWWAGFIATTYRDEDIEVLTPHPWRVTESFSDEFLHMADWTRYERTLLPDSADLSPFTG